MAKRKSIGAIKEPTIRKIKNRGWIPVQYHTETGFEYGWIIDETPKYITIRMQGAEKNKRVPKKERRYMKEL